MVAAYVIYEAKSCKAVVSNTKKTLDSGHAYGDETNKAIDCMMNPKCHDAQSHQDAANKAVKDNAQNAADTVSSAATTVPGTTVTGPSPASPSDAASGIISNIMTDIFGP